MRADPAMTNARELIEAIVYRMSETREVQTELVNFAGNPLVRSIHWKDHPQAKIPPEKSRSDGILASAVGCFAAVPILVMLAIWKAFRPVRSLCKVKNRRTMREQGPSPTMSGGGVRINSLKRTFLVGDPMCRCAVREASS